MASCAPPTAPLYHDYEQAPELVRQRGEAPSEEDMARLASALEEAGWTVKRSDLPGVVATEPRTVRRWGLYRIDVSLEAAPVGERHVRIFVHPFRRFITGGRSKLFAMDRGLRRTLLPPLDSAFVNYGFEPLGSVRQREERALPR